MTELIYCYDGSFEGFLCCVFDSYANREVPTAICRDEDFVPTLFSSRSIPTDQDHAGRVYRKVVKCSPRAAELLRKGFLTCLPDRELHLYRLVRKLLQEGPGFLGNLSDPVLYPVAGAVRHLEGEAHLLKGFVRFSDLGGVLGGEIEPKNRVLPILRGHFCARYLNERFFLYDRTHREALFYAAGKAVIRPLADFHMPKRYWNTMTEFQDESYFRAQSSPAAVSAPGAPTGIPVPGTLPTPGLSALESAP